MVVYLYCYRGVIEFIRGGCGCWLSGVLILVFKGFDFFSKSHLGKS